jgi:hypothetical protein
MKEKLNELLRHGRRFDSSFAIEDGVGREEAM